MSTIEAESSYLKIDSSNIQNILLSGDAFIAIQNTFCFQTVKIEADEIKMHINKSQAASNVYKLNLKYYPFNIQQTSKVFKLTNYNCCLERSARSTKPFQCAFFSPIKYNSQSTTEQPKNLTSSNNNTDTNVQFKRKNLEW